MHPVPTPAYASDSKGLRKLVFVGVSHRAIRIFQTMRDEMSPSFDEAGWRLAGLWDIDPRRFDAFEAAYPEAAGLPRYEGTESLTRMLKETRPDLAFISTRDGDHAEGIITCLEAGVNVLVEKPMVISADQARAVLEAEKKSSASLRVAFNYRYGNRYKAVKEVVAGGRLGRITQVDLHVMLNEIHGASYFQRWNRYRDISGGLTIHKESHYLDLLQWWIDQRPVEVFGYSGLNYYGPDAEMNPSRRDGRHCSSCEERAECAYYQVRAQKDAGDDHVASMRERVRKTEHKLGDRRNLNRYYSGYAPDACLFDSDIDIEDTYSTVIRYDRGTICTVCVNFSAPFERHRLVINGTRGRLEAGYPFSKGDSYQGEVIAFYPLFSDAPEYLDVPERKGGHGGGDPAMLEDYFFGDGTHICRATALDGAYAVAAGEAMWRSPKTGQPVQIADLMGEWA